MSDEPQPELRWAPLEPAPKRTGRIWLIVGLSVAALVIVGVLLFLFLPRGESPDPGASPSATPSSTPTATPSPSPTATPEPTQTPITTPPPVVDPTVDAFRDQVSGLLGDAPRGLDIVAGAGGSDALPVVETLQQDAQRLSDAQPPSSIADQWRDGLSAYSQQLADLNAVVTSGASSAAAVEAARAGVQNLRALVGL